MSLSWNPPYNDGGSSISCYRVYRGTSSSTLLYLKNTTQTSIIDGGLSNGQTYYYQVTAVNIVGEGAKSDTVHRTLSSPPGPLLDFQAVASASRVNLTWTAPSDNGGSAVTGYLIYRSLISGQETFLQQVTSSTSYQDSNLATGSLTITRSRPSTPPVKGRGPTSWRVSRPPFSDPHVGHRDAIQFLRLSELDRPSEHRWFSRLIVQDLPRHVRHSFLFLASVNLTGYRDTNLTNGHGYFYKVSSVNAVGEGLPARPSPPRRSTPPRSRSY